MSALRQYQEAADDAVLAHYEAGRTRVVLVIPTGGGKTMTATLGRVRAAYLNGHRVLWVVHRNHLIPQASRTFTRAGIEHGIINPNFPADASQNVQIASVQTWLRRDHGEYDLVVIDECHRRDFHAVHEEYAGKALILGLTATPERMGGETLHGEFDAMVVGATYSELLASGDIVPPRFFIPDSPNLTNLKLSASGEVNEDSAAELMSTPALVGSVVQNYLRLSAGLPALVFACNRHHARILETEFNKNGVAVEVIDGDTPQESREMAQERLVKGSLAAIINVGVYIEGLDIPQLRTIIIARPTESLSLWMQMCNRGGRPWEGKEHFLLILHTGGLFIHGSPVRDQPWTLEPTIRAKRKLADGLTIKHCPKCFYVYGPGDKMCPACKTTAPPKMRRYGKGGDLVEVSPELVAAIKPKKIVPKEEARRRQLWAIATKKHIPNPHEWVKEQQAKDKFKSQEKAVKVGGSQIVIPLDPQKLW